MGQYYGENKHDPLMVYVALIAVVCLLYFIPPVKVKVTAIRAMVYSLELKPFSPSLSKELKDYSRFLFYAHPKQIEHLDYVGVLKKAVEGYRKKMFLFYDLPLIIFVGWFILKGLRVSDTTHDKPFNLIKVLEKCYGLKVNPKEMDVYEIKKQYDEARKTRNIPVNLLKRLYQTGSPERLYLETGDMRYILTEIDPMNNKPKPRNLVEDGI